MDASDAVGLERGGRREIKTTWWYLRVMYPSLVGSEQPMTFLCAVINLRPQIVFCSFSTATFRRHSRFKKMKKIKIAWVSIYQRAVDAPTRADDCQLEG